mmetsp:Transcript_4535/g.6950  ORF Transcript_4535/g.6950 Transcript_4535/m.6950 type:complete len:91 (+) Transcript_4535:14-286(+)
MEQRKKYAVVKGVQVKPDLAGCVSGMEHGILSKYVVLKDAKIWCNIKEFVFGMGPSQRLNCVAFKIVKIRLKREGCAEGIRHTLENSEKL